jgi:hypothetical protein
LSSGWRHLGLFGLISNFFDGVAKKIIIEGCKQASSNSFNKIGESKELPQRNAGLQNDSVTLSDNAPMNAIKFIIADGWEDFTSVHSINPV